MNNKVPNKIIAPIIIVGITVGFLVSAYKFIFAQQPTLSNTDKVEDSSK